MLCTNICDALCPNIGLIFQTKKENRNQSIHSTVPSHEQHLAYGNQVLQFGDVLEEWLFGNYLLKIESIAPIWLNRFSTHLYVILNRFTRLHFMLPSYLR